MALERKGILSKVPLDKAFVNGKIFFLNLTNRGPVGAPFYPGSCILFSQGTFTLKSLPIRSVQHMTSMLLLQLGVLFFISRALKLRALENCHK